MLILCFAIDWDTYYCTVLGKYTIRLCLHMGDWSMVKKGQLSFTRGFRGILLSDAGYPLFTIITIRHFEHNKNLAGGFSTSGELATVLQWLMVSSCKDLIGTLWGLPKPHGNPTQTLCFSLSLPRACVGLWWELMIFVIGRPQPLWIKALHRLS